MDIQLLNKVKKTINYIKKEYDVLYGSSTKEDIKKEIILIYKITKENIEALYKVNENIIVKENTEYNECNREIKNLIVNLFKLCIHFIREQEFNINITNQRIATGDSESYLKDVRYKQQNILSNCNRIDSNVDNDITNKIDKYISEIISDTKERYTNSFGFFKDISEANRIIEKEYRDATRYIELFFIMKETIYENFDNYDILITAIQNIAYELIQLSSVLHRAIDMKEKISSNIFNNPNDSLKAYFVIMDGINSTINNSTEKLLTGTAHLNIETFKNPKFKSLCNFRTYKQDEIQGLFVGDIDEFLGIVDNIYASEVKVAYASKPLSQLKKSINNIEDSVFNIPFNLYGDICSEARKNMQNNNYVVYGNKNNHKLS